MCSWESTKNYLIMQETVATGMKVCNFQCVSYTKRIP